MAFLLVSLMTSTPVLVTGSIYLLGEVMERLHFAESPNQGMLQDG